MKNLIFKTRNVELDWTANKYVYNRLYKKYLNNIGEIHCDRCRYHRCENWEKKYYGGYERTINGKTFMKMSYPNWKLISKNKRQWIDKPKSYKVIDKVSKFTKKRYIEIKF